MLNKYFNQDINNNSNFILNISEANINSNQKQIYLIQWMPWIYIFCRRKVKNKSDKINLKNK